MLKRTESGKLQLNILDLQLFLGELFSKCKSEKDVEWLSDNIHDAVDLIADEKLCELE